MKRDPDGHSSPIAWDLEQRLLRNGFLLLLLLLLRRLLFLRLRQLPLEPIALLLHPLDLPHMRPDALFLGLQLRLPQDMFQMI